MDQELEQKWDKLWKIRDEVNKALEIKRQEKFIGNALESKVTLYTDSSTGDILAVYKDFLPALFIVSEVDIDSISKAPDTVYKSTEMKNLAIEVARARGKKCQRCWNWSDKVGTYDDHPELCQRCHEVLTV